MQVPRPVMDSDLKANEKELTDDINNLTKKVCNFSVYISTIQLTFTNACHRANTWRSSLMMPKHNCVTLYVLIICILQLY